MKKLFAFLLALLVLLAPAVLAEAEPANPAAGDWFASVEGVPITFSLNPDGSYTLAMPAALSASQSGTWVLDDGFVRLSDGSVLNLVSEDTLIWTANSIFFTREPPALYAPADLMPDVILELYAGYWRCAYIDIVDAIVPADVMDESTDLYIENATVALGGPRFSDIFWTFDYANGALTADVNGQSVALALQQDGFLRLTLPDAVLYLLPVLTEEAEEE